jgi:hypothetical protein
MRTYSRAVGRAFGLRSKSLQIPVSRLQSLSLHRLRAGVAAWW